MELIFPCLRVLVDSNTEAGPGSSFCSMSGRPRVEVVLTPGTYFVEVSSSGGAEAGAYTVIYEPLVPGNAQVLAADVPVNDSITPGGDLDLYTFTLATSQRVVLEATGTGLTPCMRLLTPADAGPVAGGSACFGGDPAVLDPVLPAGIYFVEIASTQTGTGSYTLVMQQPEDLLACSPPTSIDATR